MSSMKDQLDRMLEDAAAEPAPPPCQDTTLPAPPDPKGEPDPFAHLMGASGGFASEEDPFTAGLDAMLAQEGMSRETEASAKTEGFEQHEWEFKKELVYEDDDVEAICRKCFRQMRMKREQTFNEAMASHQVNPDCGMGVASEVMDS